MSIKTLLKLTALFTYLFYPSVSFSTQSNLPEECLQLFNATEKIITDAKRQPGTHIHLDKIENKFNQNKKKIMEMESTTKIKICNEGLIRLNLQSKSDDSDAN